jgi:peroxiredoxin
LRLSVATLEIGIFGLGEGGYAMVEIGQDAPDFSLPDQNRNPWKLSDHSGKKIVLVFFPFAFSSVCGQEMCAIRDEYREFEEEGALVVGISCDTVHSLKAWSDQNGFDFPVLSDRWPLGEVSKSYGAFDEKVGAAKRRTVVIGPDGKISQIIESPNLATPRSTSDYHSALKGL